MARLRRPRHPIPVFVRAALVREGLMRAYQLRPAYQRNDYVGWISRAKLPATQLRRLEQMLDELQRGNLYMNMKWKPRVRRDRPDAGLL